MPKQLLTPRERMERFDAKRKGYEKLSKAVILDNLANQLLRVDELIEERERAAKEFEKLSEELNKVKNELTQLQEEQRERATSQARKMGILRDLLDEVTRDAWRGILQE